jgi:hypothetical protein
MPRHSCGTPALAPSRRCRQRAARRPRVSEPASRGRPIEVDRAKSRATSARPSMKRRPCDLFPAATSAPRTPDAAQTRRDHPYWAFRFGPHQRSRKTAANRSRFSVNRGTAQGLHAGRYCDRSLKRTQLLPLVAHRHVGIRTDVISIHGRICRANDRWTFRATRFVSRSSCCHTRRTRHPRRRSSLPTNLSRARFPLSLRSQNSRLLFGIAESIGNAFGPVPHEVPTRCVYPCPPLLRKG